MRPSRLPRLSRLSRAKSREAQPREAQPRDKLPDNLPIFFAVILPAPSEVEGSEAKDLLVLLFANHYPLLTIHFVAIRAICGLHCSHLERAVIRAATARERRFSIRAATVSERAKPWAIERFDMTEPDTTSPANAEEQEKTGIQAVPEQTLCPIGMYRGATCHRPIYNAPRGVDKRPVCLMHSHDPKKDQPAFWQEFERILKKAGKGTADFSLVVFPEASFVGREFIPKCIFHEARFTQKANFRGATFTQVANFIETRFTQEADFRGATFTQVANFIEARFTQEADFIEATFTQEADFGRATFKDLATFSYARFLGQAEFRKTEFPKQEGKDDTPGAVFTRARFEKPEEVTFYQTDLSRALFHNCDVSKFAFSNVTWRKRANSKNMVFDEVVNLENEEAAALRPPENSPDDRNFSRVAELYQQLKKNYDDRRDYWTAGDFHYGEMELKRQSSRSPYSVFRRLHRSLGLVAWYRRASEYGESYVWPLAWPAFVLLIFTLLFPVAGLHRQDVQSSAPVSFPQSNPQSLEAPPAHDVSYSSFLQFIQTHPRGQTYAVAEFFGNALMTTLYVASFQREFVYQPSYPWGCALALLELLLTSTLIALFLLAVRRHCRR